MTTSSVHYSSATPEWYTPWPIIDRVLTVLGEIDLDPCSNPGLVPNVPATRHYIEADDGLAQPWRGKVYLNPPYGRTIGQWVEKLRRAHIAGDVPEAIALLPARTDTAWFQPLLRRYPICFVRGRLKFSDSAMSAPFPSAVVYVGERADAFLAAFRDIGTIVDACCPV